MKIDDQKQQEEEVKKEEKIEEKDDIKKEIEIWQNKYLRALADYQNLDRRHQEEVDRNRREANKRLLLQFLEVLDDICKGELFVKDHGLQLIKEKFIKILERQGVKELEVVNKIFNPETAECIELVEGDKDNIVVEITRKGYALHGDILRAAQVKVAKKNH